MGGAGALLNTPGPDTSGSGSFNRAEGCKPWNRRPGFGSVHEPRTAYYRPGCNNNPWQAKTLGVSHR